MGRPRRQPLTFLVGVGVYGLGRVVHLSIGEIPLPQQLQHATHLILLNEAGGVGVDLRKELSQPALLLLELQQQR